MSNYLQLNNSRSDRLEEFNKLEADVIGVSVDNEFSHLAWT